MRVRRARPEDAAAIENLYKALVGGDENIKVEGPRLLELERHPTNHLLVLEVAGDVLALPHVREAHQSLEGEQ